MLDFTRHTGLQIFMSYFKREVFKSTPPEFQSSQNIIIYGS